MKSRASLSFFGIVSISFLFFVASVPQADARPAPKAAVILIPGTGNSLIPGSLRQEHDQGLPRLEPYFSSSIIESIQSENDAVYVVPNLLPFGQFEKNGEITLREMTRWYLHHFPDRKTPLILVGHSAGGFYALHAATLNSLNGYPLPITQLILVSTAFDGLKLAEFAESYPHLTRLAESAVEFISNFLDLRGLSEFTQDNLSSFLSHIRIDPRTHIHLAGGSQPRPLHWGEARDPNFLNPILSTLTTWIGEENETDGLVEPRSAYGFQNIDLIRDLQGHRIQVKRLETLPLDHFKQILDFRILELLGQDDTRWISEAQSQAYSRLIRMAD